MKSQYVAVNSDRLLLFEQTEEEKVHLERKTREAELLTARLVDESERRAAEADRLKDELLRARLAEKQAKEKLLEFLSRNAYNSISVSMEFSSHGYEQ
jgi:merlin protein